MKIFETKYEAKLEFTRARVASHAVVFRGLVLPPPLCGEEVIRDP